MNRHELEVAAEERLFVAMLDRVARGPAVAERMAAPTSSRGLAAALMLLGLLVVGAVVVMARPEQAVARAPQEPEPLPPLVKVRGLAELELADRGAANLACALAGPDFGLLREFAALRALRVEQDFDLPFGTLDQSAWSLAPIAGCGKLESLSVGHLARFTAAELAPIGALPNLRSLELVGREKEVDAALVAVLAKLPLRSLVLHAVSILPEGFRALGELPLLERLELRDCSGLEKCDLLHLYRLRQLRSLTLRGVGNIRSVLQSIPLGTEWNVVSAAIQAAQKQRVSAEWVRGLAKGLPSLLELDLAECSLDDETLADLPKRLTFVGLNGSGGFGEAGIAAVCALPNLTGLAMADASKVPASGWWPFVRRCRLHRIEFTGVPTKEFLDVLRGQVELREVKVHLPATLSPAESAAMQRWNREWAESLDALTPGPAARTGAGQQPRSAAGDAGQIERTLRGVLPDHVRIEVLPFAGKDTARTR